MPKKTLLFVNHEGHQYDPEYGTLWSDTWAEFKVRRSKSDPRAQRRSTWRGKNWLGQVLTEVREELLRAD